MTDEIDLAPFDDDTLWMVARGALFEAGDLGADLAEFVLVPFREEIDQQTFGDVRAQMPGGAWAVTITPGALHVYLWAAKGRKAAIVRAHEAIATEMRLSPDFGARFAAPFRPLITTAAPSVAALRYSLAPA